MDVIKIHMYAKQLCLVYTSNLCTLLVLLFYNSNLAFKPFNAPQPCQVQWNFRILDMLGPRFCDVVYTLIEKHLGSLNVRVLYREVFLLCALFGVSIIGGSTVKVSA